MKTRTSIFLVSVCVFMLFVTQVFAVKFEECCCGEDSYKADLSVIPNTDYQFGVQLRFLRCKIECELNDEIHTLLGSPDTSMETNVRIWGGLEREVTRRFIREGFGTGANEQILDDFGVLYEHCNKGDKNYTYCLELALNKFYLSKMEMLRDFFKDPENQCLLQSRYFSSINIVPSLKYNWVIRMFVNEPIYDYISDQERSALYYGFASMHHRVNNIVGLFPLYISLNGWNENSGDELKKEAGRAISLYESYEFKKFLNSHFSAYETISENSVKTSGDLIFKEFFNILMFPERDILITSRVDFESPEIPSTSRYSIFSAPSERYNFVSRVKFLQAFAEIVVEDNKNPFNIIDVSSFNPYGEYKDLPEFVEESPKIMWDVKITKKHYQEDDSISMHLSLKSKPVSEKEKTTSKFKPTNDWGQVQGEYIKHLIQCAKGKLGLEKAVKCDSSIGFVEEEVSK